MQDMMYGTEDYVRSRMDNLARISRCCPLWVNCHSSTIAASPHHQRLDFKLPYNVTRVSGMEAAARSRSRFLQILLQPSCSRTLICSVCMLSVCHTSQVNDVLLQSSCVPTNLKTPRHPVSVASVTAVFKHCWGQCMQSSCGKDPQAS